MAFHCIAWQYCYSYLSWMTSYMFKPSAEITFILLSCESVGKSAFPTRRFGVVRVTRCLVGREHHLQSPSHQPQVTTSFLCTHNGHHRNAAVMISTK